MREHRQVMALALLLLAASVALGQEAETTQPATAPAVRADAVTHDAVAPTSDGEMQLLRDEVARLRAEVQTLKSQQSTLDAQQPTPSVRAQPAPAATPLRAQTPPPASEVTKTLPEQPAPARPVPVVRLPAYATVQVTDVEVRSTKRNGSPGIYVVSNVTLVGVRHIPFTFQAVLVTPDEQIHTNAQSRPYVATREVRTGDEEDTDDYGVFLDLGDLFSSRPPEDLYVQIRILDQAGNVVAKSGLHTFKRPWQ